MNRQKLIAAGFALPVAIAAAAVSLAVPGPARTASVAYPDLAMARLTDLSVVNASGQLQLRFSATIVNIGQGPFELSATRADVTSPFEISQKLYDGSGGIATLPVPGASLAWGGDGHSHWHVRDLETYELQRLDNGSKVGTGMKSGFCFFDTTAFNTTLPGAPSSAVYVPGTVCGQNDQAAATLRMGISVGWGDRYGASLRDQYINVTGLTSGNYRLVATADGQNQFSETRDDNNTTWANLKLTLNSKGKGGSKVSIVGYGPTP